MSGTTFGNRLKEMLDLRGISNYRVAKDLNIHAGTVANYLADKTKPNNIILNQLSSYLNTSKEWLEHGEGEKQLSIVSDPIEPYGSNIFSLIDSLSSYHVPNDIIQGIRNEVISRDQKITDVQDKLIRTFEAVDEWKKQKKY